MALTYSLILIFSIVFLGITCIRKGLFTDSQVTGFEVFLFKIALPCYLFSSIHGYNFFMSSEYDYFYSYLLVFLIVLVVTMFSFWKSRVSAELFIKILASGYVNTAIYALPVITLLLGDPRAGIIGNLIQVVVIQSLFVTILSFVKHRESSLSRKLLTPLSNPLILMPSVGLLLNYYHILPPKIVMIITESLGNSAPSMALFAFGLSLGNIELNKSLLDKNVVFIVLIKNIIHPIVAYIIGTYVFQLDRYWLCSLVIAASAPTAFVVYIISKQFDVAQHLIKKVVALSSLISLIFLIIIAYITTVTKS